MTAFGLYKSFLPVVEAHAISSHEVAVRFADGKTSSIDLSDLIGKGPWKRLSDPGFFKKAHAAFDTVIWSDDVDIAPEEIWERAHNATV